MYQEVEGEGFIQEVAKKRPYIWIIRLLLTLILLLELLCRLTLYRLSSQKSVTTEL